MELKRQHSAVPYVMARAAVWTQLVGLGIAAVLMGIFIWENSRPAVGPIAAIGVNPNVAPWWELAELPQVGENAARSLVAYREERGGRVFETAEDLRVVSGIGAMALRRMAGDLDFSEGSAK